MKNCYDTGFKGNTGDESRPLPVPGRDGIMKIPLNILEDGSGPCQIDPIVCNIGHRKCYGQRSDEPGNKRNCE